MAHGATATASSSTSSDNSDGTSIGSASETGTTAKSSGSTGGYSSIRSAWGHRRRGQPRPAKRQHQQPRAPPPPKLWKPVAVVLLVASLTPIQPVVAAAVDAHANVVVADAAQSDARRHTLSHDASASASLIPPPPTTPPPPLTPDAITIPSSNSPPTSPPHPPSPLQLLTHQTRDRHLTSDNLDQEAARSLGRRGNGQDAVSQVHDAPMTRKKMDEEAVAGIVVGVVLGVALLICCLYPVVVRHVKKHRRAKYGYSFRGQPSFTLRRLSSSGSYKRDDPGTTVPAAHDPAAAASPLPHHPQQYAFARSHSHPAPDGVAGYYYQPSPAGGAPADPANPGITTPYVNASLDPNIAIQPFIAPIYSDAYLSNPFPPCHGSIGPNETLPIQQVVLKGTSEDYYCPHIPSEAFGMYATPDSPAASIIQKPQRAVSSSRIGRAVRGLFRSPRHDSFELGPGGYAYDGSRGLQAGSSPIPQHHMPLPPQQQQPIPPHLAYVHAPLQEHGGDFAAAQEVNRYGGYYMPPPPPGHQQQVPPPQPRNSAGAGTGGLAPVTVNPMDIMPASTESELWHRTDFQMLASSHDSQPDYWAGPPIPQQQPQYLQQYVPTSPSPETFQPDAVQQQQQQQQQQQVSPPEPSPQDQLAPLPSQPQSEPSQPQHTLPSSSEHAPPPPQVKIEPSPDVPDAVGGPIKRESISSGTGNTDGLAAPSSSHTAPAAPSTTTTHSTPSSQIDSASPDSQNSSSDFNQSASPHGLGVPSPKSGLFCCDEPGCNQVFDQPHKLKHHRRYHSKDHKCPYPTCGKGFGTKTHLQRHINDRHEKKKKFHCSMPGCDYSRQGGKAFPRKDNWKRHMTKIHGMDHRKLPEPVEIDQDMTG